jgi:hypothetical protein
VERLLPVVKLRALQLESGDAIPIADVHVGDKVLAVSSAGQPFFDKVFRITHHEPTETMEFVHITTSSGDVLEVSGTHTVHVGECDRQREGGGVATTCTTAPQPSGSQGPCLGPGCHSSCCQRQAPRLS